jgi:hypothetical protein
MSATLRLTLLISAFSISAPISKPEEARASMAEAPIPRPVETTCRHSSRSLDSSITMYHP